MENDVLTIAEFGKLCPEQFWPSNGSFEQVVGHETEAGELDGFRINRWSFFYYYENVLISANISCNSDDDWNAARRFLESMRIPCVLSLTLDSALVQLDDVLRSSLVRLNGPGLKSIVTAIGHADSLYALGLAVGPKLTINAISVTPFSEYRRRWALE